MQLIAPTLDLPAGYGAALRRGGSPDNLRPAVAAQQLAQIAGDPEGFCAGFDDPRGQGGPVTRPDGRRVARPPSIRRWIWDDGICGTIGLRWQTGTEALPPGCPGHVGYAVVPWRRGEGLATAALRAVLPPARAVGLRWIEVTTDPGNAPFRRVIVKAGGVFAAPDPLPRATGGRDAVHYRIALSAEGGGGGTGSAR
ncbi:GNAT family N-acetyltransferase [Rhodobacteraceae bacterium CCMM004]|nr:GNAT family N-acetyltransferase [Rhodobacteraceae bacterium CCMM004]